MSNQVPRDRLPRHIAFIMDGNGRWARSRSLRRLKGPEQGAESLRRIVQSCRRLGIPETTFYALSAENFERRPRRELAYLMGLLKRFLIDERPELTEQRIRLQVIGKVDAFPQDVQRELAETVRLTQDYDRMILRLALNYGGRQEILSACRSIVAAVASGQLSPTAVESLGVEGFRSYLSDPAMTDPDLLIRTAGEYRLSNFLLWQVSYSEIWITDSLWPDFDVAELEAALSSFAKRKRKFGAVGNEDDAKVADSEHLATKRATSSTP